MITTQDLDRMISEDINDYRDFARHLRSCKEALDEAHKAHAYTGERNAIRNTILDASDRIELCEVERIVATLIISTAWDGRIDPRNAKWAAECYAPALDEEAAKRMYIFNSIHPCHLDQIATELRRNRDRYYYSVEDKCYRFYEENAS